VSKDKLDAGKLQKASGGESTTRRFLSFNGCEAYQTYPGKAGDMLFMSNNKNECVGI
jgi:hypothetical protein